MNILTLYQKYNKIIFRFLSVLLIFTSFFMIERFIYLSNVKVLPWVRDIFSYSFLIFFSIFVIFTFFEKKILKEYFLKNTKVFSYFLFLIIYCFVLEIIIKEIRFDLILDLLWVFFIYVGFELLSHKIELRKEILKYSMIILVFFSIFLILFVPCVSFNIFDLFFETESYCKKILSFDQINFVNLSKDKSIAYIMNFILIYLFLVNKNDELPKNYFSYFITSILFFFVLLIIKSKSGLIIFIFINILILFLIVNKTIKLLQIICIISYVFLSINTILIKPVDNIFVLWSKIFSLSISNTSEIINNNKVEINLLDPRYPSNKIVLKDSQYNSYDTRIETSKKTLNLFFNNFWFGVGFNDLNKAKYKNFISHSYILNFMAAYGIISFLLLNLIIFYVLNKNLKKNKKLLFFLFFTFIYLIFLATPDLPWFFGILFFILSNKKINLV